LRVIDKRNSPLLSKLSNFTLLFLFLKNGRRPEKKSDQHRKKKSDQHRKKKSDQHRKKKSDQHRENKSDQHREMSEFFVLILKDEMTKKNGRQGQNKKALPRI